jgi:hypothetical protein
MRSVINLRSHSTNFVTHLSEQQQSWIQQIQSLRYTKLLARAKVRSYNTKSTAPSDQNLASIVESLLTVRPSTTTFLLRTVSHP